MKVTIFSTFMLSAGFLTTALPVTPDAIPVSAPSIDIPVAAPFVEVGFSDLGKRLDPPVINPANVGELAVSKAFSGGLQDSKHNTE
ncbi:hypothetical protein TWF694_011490 [Orbilia ellipsospora]|uniref:Uncharacterized protein n=1 Tax=Orbilia ellipsospora TaxID=2528407 RepID=A0AAV9X5R2_9PEZI